MHHVISLQDAPGTPDHRCLPGIMCVVSPRWGVLLRADLDTNYCVSGMSACDNSVVYVICIPKAWQLRVVYSSGPLLEEMGSTSPMRR